MKLNNTGLKGDKVMQEDLSYIKTFSDVTNSLNGGVVTPPNCGYNTLSTTTGNSIDPKILIDKAKIKRVFSNIITNSINRFECYGQTWKR